jgi:hypothetical protein
LGSAQHRNFNEVAVILVAILVQSGSGG